MATTLPSGILKLGKSYQANPKDIKRREGWNPRFDFGDLAELAKSIKVQRELTGSSGLLMPLRVKRLDPSRLEGAVFELVDGDRRLSAIELLMEEGFEFPEGVPIVLVPKEQTDLNSLLQMYETNTGKPFLPLEEASAFKRMRDAGLTIKDICAKVGRSDIHVMGSLALLEADAELQDAVKSGAVGITVAKEIATIAKGDKETQKELTAQAKAAGNDKSKKRALLVNVRAAQVKKAEGKGKVLSAKMRSLDEVKVLIAKAEQLVVASMKTAKIEIANTDSSTLVAAVAADDATAAAYQAGFLQALRFIAGDLDTTPAAILEI